MIPGLWHIVVKAANGRPERGLGQPRERGCSTARLPKGKMNTYMYSNLKLSGFE